MTPLHRRLAPLCAAVLVLVTLTACSTPEPDETANALAAELTAGALTAVPSTESPDLATMFGGLAEADRTVTLLEWRIDEEDADLAHIDLEWTWDVVGHEWTYTTAAQAVWAEDAWTVQWDPAIVHPAAQADSVFEVSRTRPDDRAEIVSPTSGALVTSRAVYNIGVDKTFVTDAEAQRAAAIELAEGLGFEDPESYAARVEAAGERAFVLAVTVRQEDAAAWNVEELRQIEGVNAVSATAQLGPSSRFARPILGRVGEATAEIIESSEGRVVAGDMVGLGGLQEAYDEQLAGVPGVEVVLTIGENPQPVFGAPPEEGTPLAITLNQPLQDHAETVLEGEEGIAALVAIEPSTGQILAAATTDSWNASSLGQHAPGSTFKVVTALALLRAGYTPDSPMECPETLVVDGRTFSNYPGYAHTGTITLRDAIAYSCNTAFLGVADEITGEDIASAALSLGIGQPGPWAFEYFSGNVPSDATGTTHAAGLFGQGEVVASPMAMATVAASIAAGHTVTPMLVVDEAPELAAGTVPLTLEESAALIGMMGAVVDYGTASAFGHLDGLFAKTGTAEVGEGEQTNAWMIAVRDDLAIAVFVEDSGSGAANAGPLVDAFFSGLTRQ